MPVFNLSHKKKTYSALEHQQVKATELQQGADKYIILTIKITNKYQENHLPI